MAHMRIGNAPCSWGVLEFDLEGEAAGCTQVLNEMAETGYLGTELGDWGFMPTDPGALAAELTKRGLTLLGAFVPVALKDPASHAFGVEAALKVAQPAACDGRPHHRLRRHSVAPFPGAGRQQRLRSRAHPKCGPRHRGDGADRRRVAGLRSRRRTGGPRGLYRNRAAHRVPPSLRGVRGDPGRDRPAAYPNRPLGVGAGLRHRSLRLCRRVPTSGWPGERWPTG